MFIFYVFTTFWGENTQPPTTTFHCIVDNKSFPKISGTEGTTKVENEIFSLKDPFPNFSAAFVNTYLNFNVTTLDKVFGRLRNRFKLLNHTTINACVSKLVANKCLKLCQKNRLQNGV